MKRRFYHRIRALFVLTGCIILIFFHSAPGTAQAELYDGFDGDQIDTALWKIDDPDSMLSQSSGLLQVDGASDGTEARLSSTKVFRGDFSVVLGFTDFQSTTADPGEGCDRLSLRVKDAYHDGSYVQISRGFCIEGDLFFSKAKLNEISVPAVESVAATSPQGLLMIYRRGSAISTAFFEGSDWSTHQTLSQAFSSDVVLEIRTGHGSDGVFHVASEEVTYEGQSVTIPPSSPYFGFCSVVARNTPLGMQTVLSAQIFDPNGLGDEISSLTVSHPSGFSFNGFTPEDYVGLNLVRHTLSGAPATGEYTFTAVDKSGNMATSSVSLVSNSALPLPDPASFQASGDALSPTLSWAGLSTYKGNVFYTARIFDSSTGQVWYSNPSPNTSVRVPGGVLQDGVAYWWTVEALDSYSPYTCNRAALVWPISLTTSGSTRPYFDYADVYTRNLHDGPHTLVEAKVNDPGLPFPGDIDTLKVTGPGGFSHSLEISECTTSGCAHLLPSAPANGIYSFILGKSGGEKAYSYDYAKSSLIPLVATDTMQASGSSSGPTLSWGAPFEATRALFYLVWIFDADGKGVWSSPLTSDTVVKVPDGTLGEGPYRWSVRAWDNNNGPHSNRSENSVQGLTLDNTTPYFRWVAVYRVNGISGFKTWLDASVYDPDGTVPDSLTITVTGPNKFSYTFQPQDYIDMGYNEYWAEISKILPEGPYTFTVTDTDQNSAVSYHYLGARKDIPLFNPEGFVVTDNPLAPTIAWSAIKGYNGPLFYRLRIRDSQGKDVWRSNREPTTCRTVPPGLMQAGQSYTFRVEATDDRIFPILVNRSNSAHVPITETTWIPGSLTVEMSPQGAVSAGARWRVSGHAYWKKSGEIVSGLTAGPHTVEFKDVAGWKKPAPQQVAITSDETATASGEYVQLPEVTITATDASASEPGKDTGRFMLTRTGSTSSALEVSYAVGGTATNGKDYTKLTGKVNIPAGKASATIHVKPKDDNFKEPVETVILTLKKASTYRVGSKNKATVRIRSNE